MLIVSVNYFEDKISKECRTRMHTINLAIFITIKLCKVNPMHSFHFSQEFESLNMENFASSTFSRNVLG